MGEVLAVHDSVSVCVRLRAEVLHCFAIERELGVKTAAFRLVGIEVTSKLGFNNFIQMVRRAGKGGLEFEGRSDTFIVWQLVERIPIELNCYAFNHAWVIGVHTFEKDVILLQFLMSCSENRPRKIRHCSQRIKKLKGLLVGTDHSLSSKAVVLMKGHGHSNCECDQRADGLSPAGCARMLLKPNNKPFHSASLQFLNRIAMVHDWRGGANV